MAALLESHMKSNEKNEIENKNTIENNNNNIVEKDAFENVTNLLQNSEGKVLNKKKMKKKEFED